MRVLLHNLTYFVGPREHPEIETLVRGLKVNEGIIGGMDVPLATRLFGDLVSFLKLVPVGVTLLWDSDVGEFGLQCGRHKNMWPLEPSLAVPEIMELVSVWLRGYYPRYFAPVTTHHSPPPEAMLRLVDEGVSIEEAVGATILARGWEYGIVERMEDVRRGLFVLVQNGIAMQLQTSKPSLVSFLKRMRTIREAKARRRYCINNSRFVSFLHQTTRKVEREGIRLWNFFAVHSSRCGLFPLHELEKGVWRWGNFHLTVKPSDHSLFMECQQKLELYRATGNRVALPRICRGELKERR